MVKTSWTARIAPPVLVLALLAFLVRFLMDPVETVKWIGAPFLLLPRALGIVPAADAEAARWINLKQDSPVLEIPAAGTYSLYAADDVMQLRANMLSNTDVAWVRLRLADAVDASGDITGTTVKRGAAIYDVTEIRGRPVVSFRLAAAGRYTLIYPQQTGQLVFAADPVTGREGVILASIAVQVLVIAAVVMAAAWPGIRARRARARAAADELARKRAATDAFLGRSPE